MTAKKGTKSVLKNKPNKDEDKSDTFITDISKGKLVSSKRSSKQLDEEDKEEL